MIVIAIEPINKNLKFMYMKLFEGDCLTIMEDFSDNSVDIVIADLPYGRFSHLAGKDGWDNPIDLKKMWRELWRICKDTCPIFLFGDFKFVNILLNSQPKYFRYELVWNKKQSTNFMNARKMPGKATEYILVFYKKLPTYNYLTYHKRIPNGGGDTNKRKTQFLNGGGKINKKSSTYEPRLPLNILECRNVKNKKLIKNITEKPQFILEWLLKYYSNEGDTCLDITMGSGSCGLACKTLKREFIGIELCKKHFEIAKARLS
tara:strand:+ start:24674 stop:25456 length:783 start_codon:yes stop_codon:yes gene_type:complete